MLGFGEERRGDGGEKGGVGGLCGFDLDVVSVFFVVWLVVGGRDGGVREVW